MIENRIFARNKEGKKTLACNLAFPSLEVVEMAGIAGFDAIFVDGEHGPFGLSDLEAIVRLAHPYGMTVFGRTPNTAPDTITQWLDRGIQGVMAPHVETAEQARTLVEAAYYPPLGHRSWGTGRGNLFNDGAALEKAGGRPAFMAWANENTWLFVQIESRRGYENMDDIVAVEGIDAVTFGPFDLGTSLGYAGEGAGHPEIDRVQADIEKRTRDTGKGLMSDRVAMFALGSTLSGAMRDFIDSRREEPFTG